MKNTKNTPKTEKIMGHVVRVGSKRHAILLQQKRQFDDNLRSEVGNGR